MKRLSRDSFTLTGDEINVLADLAHLTAHSKQSITRHLRDLGESAVKFLGELKPMTKAPAVTLRGCKLKPGETCLMCGTEAVKPERKKSKRPVCHVCSQPFTRATPWRLLRGRRIHVACIK